MTDTAATALVPGISAAEYRCVRQGAREFSGTQVTGAPAGLAGALAGDFRALAAPAASREPALREVYSNAVTTPADPRHSVHLAFAIDRDQPPP